jgi:hypothetical protein
MELKIVIVDDTNVIIKKAPVSIHIINQDNTIDINTDDDGTYTLALLPADRVEISVKAPVEREYPLDEAGRLKRYAISAGDNKIEMTQIDGSEKIEVLALEKTNVIKLPVRYLKQDEIDDVYEILGNHYFDTRININEIQLFKYDITRNITGNPTAKQLREILVYFGIAIPRCFQGMPDAVIEEGLKAGLSLPNGVIYLPRIAWFTSPLQFRARLVHEAFHQYQYQRGGAQKILQELIDEMNRMYIEAQQGLNSKNNNKQYYDPYQYERYAGVNITSKTNIRSLEQIQTLEGKAQFIEDFALATFGYASAYYRLSDYKPAMSNSTGSGVNTSAILA